jgi:predicted metal-dependent hydrolase
MLNTFLRRDRASLKNPAEEGHLTIEGREITYTVQRRARRRRTLALYVEKGNKIRLLVPVRTSAATIERMLDERRHWIAKRLSELESETALPPEFKNGAVFLYLGAPHTLHVTRDPLLPEGCEALDGRLNLNLHASSQAEIGEDARLEILLWYKKKAKEILKERTDYWGVRLGLKYRSLKIGNPLRRWGSCSPNNDIRYNWRVVMATVDIIDYLVVHELCHIKHKNHSKRFWALLASSIPDWRERRKQLKRLDPASAL